MTAAGRIRRLNSGSAGIVDSARCPACGHPARIHNRVGCVSGPCECVVSRSDLMPNAPRLEVPEGIEVTPAVKADTPAVPVPVTPPPGWDPHAPRRDLGPHTPGAGMELVRRELPGIVPDITEVDEARIDEIIAAGKRAARKRPRLQTARPAAPSALGSRAVVGEPDAVDEAAVPPPAATVEPVDPGDGWLRWESLPAEVNATPEPLDLTPFLGAALYYYPAWFCKGCLQRRHNPGACCRRPLVPAYVVIAPRSVS